MTYIPRTVSKLRTLLVGLALVFVIGCVPAGLTGPTPDVTAAAVEGGEFDRLLNRERADAGMPLLTISPQLQTAAQLHADEMSSQVFFSHDSQDGRTLPDRVTAQGYGYCWVAENIAQGQASEAEVMQSWMASGGHRENNLSRSAVEYGLGRTADNYWVLVLAKPGC